ncbi:MAG: LPXTG cell wall anchor domain-containing protein [Candidatus Dormibacteraeota bacterium]|nr:LPXTG cell wall anchor domain-containing protein [Candidatus Dormibacteraeota bacterium]
MPETLNTYLISATITTNKIIAFIVLVVIVAAGLFFWRRNRAV